MFPQVNMEEGCPYGYSYFITCNLSVRRDAVVQVGSFQSTYKLSEDTEMGLRLHERGYRVLYHPSAHAWHDHLPYPARNLIRRARVYGADYFYMFRNHPRVMREWAMPVKLTGMDAENALRIRDYVNQNRLQVEDAVIAIERWDSRRFRAAPDRSAGNRSHDPRPLPSGCSGDPLVLFVRNHAPHHGPRTPFTAFSTGKFSLAGCSCFR